MMKKSCTLTTLIEIIVLLVTPLFLAVELWLFPNLTAFFSLLIVLFTIALFMLLFEEQRFSVSKLVLTATFSALGAAGRIAFAPLAYIKPVSAVAIFAGVFMGRHVGFVVGALSALISNVFFGQGSWTPWQMYAWGLVGYIGGFLSQGMWKKQKGPLDQFSVNAIKKQKIRTLPPGILMFWALFSGLFYGLILNCYFVLGFVHPLTVESVVLAFLASIPFDMVHGISTLIFLLLLWVPWSNSVHRIFVKYNLAGLSDKR